MSNKGELVTFRLTINEEGHTELELREVDPEELKDLLEKQYPDYESGEELLDLIKNVSTRLNEMFREIGHG